MIRHVANNTAGDNPWPDTLGRDQPSDRPGPALPVMSGETFRASLVRIGLRQRDFAEYVGVDQRSVGRWANDRQPIPHWVQVIVSLRLKLLGTEAVFLE